MKLEEFLSEQELEFYSKLESQTLKNIDLDNFEHLKNIVSSYSHNIASINKILKKAIY